MRLRKRIGAAILAVSMAFTMFPVSSSFATEVQAAETKNMKKNAKLESKISDENLKGEKEKTSDNQEESGQGEIAGNLSHMVTDSSIIMNRAKEDYLLTVETSKEEIQADGIDSANINVLLKPSITPSNKNMKITVRLTLDQNDVGTLPSTDSSLSLSYDDSKEGWYGTTKFTSAVLKSETICKITAKVTSSIINSEEDENLIGISTKEPIEIKLVPKRVEDVIKVTDMTIADTYYSVNGKFPIYTEYEVEDTISSEKRSRLKLVVTKKDGTEVAEVMSNGYRNYFSIEECQNIKDGERSSLEFSIIDTNVDTAGTEKTIWSKTKEVTFKKQDIWASRSYLPTEVSNFSFELFISTGAAIIAHSIDGIYLCDEKGEIAAGTELNQSIYISNNDTRYKNIFKSQPSWEDLCRANIYNIYRTRKLENGEKLYLAYYIGNEKYDVKEIVFTVTDQPYIADISKNYGFYSGEDNTCVLSVNAYHIDFEKLSLVLKDSTGKEVGHSLGYIDSSRNNAYYTIKWNEGYEPKNVDYAIEYNYTGDKSLIVEENTKIISFNNSSSNGTWNPKTNSIEYYNSEIPEGSLVSYEVWDNYKFSSSSKCIASGKEIPVNSDHLMTIELKETFKISGYYYLYISIADKTYNQSIYIEANEQGQGGIYRNLDERYYLSNNQNPSFSLRLYCEDKSKLVSNCTSVIKNERGDEVGKLELSLEEGKNNYYYYKGTYKEAFTSGRYNLVFNPHSDKDTKYDINEIFYVVNSEKLSLNSQNNDTEYINLYFGSSDLSKWYCNEENRKKLQLDIFDIRNQKLKTYKLSEGHFSIEGNLENSVNLQFSETMKKELINYYFYYVKVSYNGKYDETMYVYNPLDKYYDQYSSYRARYVYSEKRSSLGMYTTKSSNNYWYNVSEKGKYTYKTVLGDLGVFPAKLIVTDWYSLKPIKTITIQNSEYSLTESDLKELSSTKLYCCFLKGADGTVWTSSEWYGGGMGCYLKAGSESEQKPETPDDDNNNDNNNNNNNNNTYTPPSYTGGSSVGGNTSPVQEEQPKQDEPKQEEKQPEDDNKDTEQEKPPVKEPEDTENTDMNQQGNNTSSKNTKGKLTLKKKKMTLKKGQKSKIKITSKLNTKVTYKSLNKSVATVSKKGVVTAKKVGKATITVKANGKTKKVKVTVKNTKGKNVSTIKLGKNFKLSEKKAVLKKGNKLTIQAASSIAGKVTYRSLNKKIASVSVKGVVKAKKKGKTAIVIKAGKKTTKLKVTVQR